MNRIYTVKPEEYPLLLGESIYKPKQLYAMGTLPPPTSVGIAMVGTRRPGNSAQELCRRLVGALRGTDAVVVSGLAQGIDSLCHEAALEAGIPTVAVLAQGLGTKIEGSRGELARRILERGGAIVSEFEPDTPAYKGNFPARNRIISGLSRATVIVQSKAKGGALITAEDIAAALWEDEPDVSKAKHRLRNLISDLRSSLKAVGQEDILIRKSGLLAVRRDAVECDFFRMLDGDMAAVNSYRGEYMKQFSWARETEARLQFL